jgi:hypothetical protein
MARIEKTRHRLCTDQFSNRSSDLFRFIKIKEKVTISGWEGIDTIGSKAEIDLACDDLITILKTIKTFAK